MRDSYFIDKKDIRLPNELDDQYVVPIKSTAKPKSTVSIVNSSSYGRAMYKAQKKLKQLHGKQEEKLLAEQYEEMLKECIEMFAKDREKALEELDDDFVDYNFLPF